MNDDYLDFPASGEATTMVIWLVRLWIELARPIDRARKRLWMGPQSTTADETHISSLSPISFCSALATADLSSFSTTFAACLGVCFNIAKACGTCLPRIISITGLAFRGATRTNRNIAFASGISLLSPVIIAIFHPAADRLRRTTDHDG
jgi:hypothetical protein